MIDIYKFIGKNGKSYEIEEEYIKENSNCPADEKSGSGPGSCGGKTEDKPDGYLGKSKDGKDIYVAGTSPKSKAIRKELAAEHKESLKNFSSIKVDPEAVQKISDTLSVVKGNKSTAYIQQLGKNGSFKVTFGKGTTFVRPYDTREEAEIAAKYYAKNHKVPGMTY